MRIERVDDTTVKLFITYSDIEARGFSREDLWTNRKRGEEFFWSMMDEINEEEDFVVEGPLWIQVHAFEKGVEVTISKSKNEDMMNMSDDDATDQFDEQVQELLAQTLEGEDQLEELFEQRTKEKEAEDLLKKYDDKVAAFQKDAKAKYKDAWPLKASVVNFRADHTRIYAGGYAGEILNDLGFKRNKDLQKQVDNGKDIIQLTSKESIPLMNADHIFVVKSDPNAKDAALVKKTESEWTSSKEWKNLDAVKNNQVSDDLDEITWNLAGGYKSSLKLIDDLYEKLNIEKQSK